MDGISQIVRGHWLMAGCSALYLAWWCIFFVPDAAGQKPSPMGALPTIGILCIIGAFLCGGLAIWFMVVGIGDLHGEAVAGWIIDLGCVALYVVILVVTRWIFERPVTSELALFCAWTALELNVANHLAGIGEPTSALARGANMAPPVLIGVVLTLVICIICYTLYYRLPPIPSFWDGCIPLVTVCVFSIGMARMLG